MRRLDAIVVGAGPAGSVAPLVLPRGLYWNNLAFPAVKNFVAQISESQPAS